MLTRAQLTDYANWIGQSPVEVRKAVIQHGGWSDVFPDKQPFPLWASRVRNYFNDRPARLKLLGVRERSLAKENACLNVGCLAGKGLFATFGFSGDVYVDEDNRNWFEMSTAGTVYHYAGKVTKLKKVDAFLSVQKKMPVFKLISPDGTGGSLEVCIHNFFHGVVGRGKSQIGPEGKWVSVRTHVVVDELHKGSYNYSETGIAGFDAHELRDVKPHKDETGFYADPSRATALSERRFVRDDRKGRPIADSAKYF